MVKKINLAAQMLASFKFENIAYMHVSIYYKGRGDGYIGVGPDLYTEGNDGRNWNKKQWQEYLTENISSGLAIKAIDISFSDKDEDADINHVTYHIEASDLDVNPAFDRTIVYADKYKIEKYEVMLTPSESKKIHGSCDVKKLYKKLQDNLCRQNKVESDLAKILPNPDPDEMPLPEW